jgi:hypothetical protein
MAKKDYVTEKEKTTIIESVRATTKRRKTSLNIHTLNIDSLLSGGTVQSVINKLHDVQSKTGAYSGARFKRGAYGAVYHIVSPAEETDIELEKRIIEKAKREIDKINNKRIEVEKEKQKKKDEKRKIVIKAMEELGDEIYDIFKEIQKKKI